MTEHAYTIKIRTDRDWITLQWLNERGYDADIYDHAALINHDGEVRTLGLTEAEAGRCLELYNDDPGAFLTCCASPTLTESLLGFIDSII